MPSDPRLRIHQLTLWRVTDACFSFISTRWPGFTYLEAPEFTYVNSERQFASVPIKIERPLPLCLFRCLLARETSALPIGGPRWAGLSILVKLHAESVPLVLDPRPDGLWRPALLLLVQLEELLFIEVLRDGSASEDWRLDSRGWIFVDLHKSSLVSSWTRC